MLTEVEKMWTIFPCGSSAVIEIRAFHHSDKSNVKRRIFRAADTSSVDNFKKRVEEYALTLNDQGYNIYITLNPIKSEFIGQSAKDKDIEYRDLLLIDIDRAGDTRNPATEAELECAKLLGEEVQQHLTSLGWAEPIWVMSGNGYHLYYILDNLPNTQEVTEAIRNALNSLAIRFDNEHVHIDTNVYNASRITKVPGTIMRKGEESPGRPYRRAVVL